ncbi:MAG: cytochrome c oxidase subunit I, partial [Acidimicrobiia bacterium]
MTAAVTSPRLVSAWAGRGGVAGFLTAVNHKDIGARFVVTACGFLVVGGVEALVMRAQLARPDGTVLGPEAYNQAFTMHGTTMMFLFAIPVLEGIAMYVVPLMIGTRDMPFPRLNAFGYWVYLFGALLLHASFLTGDVPDGGWFAYVPLTDRTFSPGSNLDFWLIGVTFVEVSGIVGAVELVVLILRHRAPGMALGRMPLFVWSVLVMAGMMLLAFPAVIAASLLLELQRKAGLPFFEPGLGGNSLLWQHLFWIFGHPEVYIMLLPAAGVVSTVVAVGSRRPIVGYPFVVAALVTIAFLSFGLWVHHMFSVGIPVLALGLFSVASSAIAVPSGIQVFAWLATMLQGRPRWTTPMLFVAGFLLTFVAGGITGVMVAAVPFDWQAHDSFFVVAHFHYVLIGGVVFPIFGALHHWFPKMTGRVPSERVGRASFWLTFAGFHVTFFPQHVLGLLGMPRRVYTYGGGDGLGGYNLVSTAGAFALAAGVALFLANLVVAWRSGPGAPDDPWEAGTFEWATSSPPPPQNFTTLPVDLEDERGGGGPPGRLAAALEELSAPDGDVREQLVTTWSSALPEAVVGLSGPSYWPLATAAALAVALAGLLVDAPAAALAGAVAAVLALVGWLDPREAARDRTTPRP